jgi:hypothetical protein
VGVAAAALGAMPAASAATHTGAPVTHAAAALDLSGYHTVSIDGMALSNGGSNDNAAPLDTVAVDNGSEQSWQFVPLGNGYYNLQNAASHLCAEIRGGNLAAGAVVDQWTCVLGSTNEEWNIVQQANGSFTISPLSSGLTLTTSSSNSSSATTQQQYTGSSLQQWTISGVGPTFSGSHVLTTAGMALDDPDSSSAQGTQLITYGPNGGSNQSWLLVSVPNSNGAYFLINASSGLYAEDYDGSYNASIVDQWSFVGSTNQQWYITPLPNGHSIITNVRSGLLLTTASTSNLSPVTQQPNINSMLQQWTVGG